MEVALDFLDHGGIVLTKAVHRLVGKHDAPAERAVCLVAFDHGDVAGWIGLLHQDREVQPGGTSAQTNDAHGSFLCCRTIIRFLDILYLN
jgi:hypothetical protein